MVRRKYFGGKYGGQFEGKSLRTIGKNLVDKFGSKLGGKHIGAQFLELWGENLEVERIFLGKTRGKFGGKSLRAMGENLWAKTGGKCLE